MSSNTEAWVVAALFLNDQAVSRGIECYPAPEARLSQQSKATRIRKTQRDYQTKAQGLRNAWPRLAAPDALSEAHRFQTEFLAQLSTE
ncbi:MAG: hypothetical protein HY774_21685 [Acidobacteria bacterium]|nr:hypothetical protein [Acidobacteriota bacterium]